jgi:hypothetical protein
MKPFAERMFTDAKKRVVERWGRGALRLIGPELTAALIKAEVLGVVAANVRADKSPLVELAAYTCEHVDDWDF